MSFVSVVREYEETSMRVTMPKHIPPGAAELSVYIDKELKMQFKLTCVAQNQSMSGVIEELVRQWVKNQLNKGEK
jgi:hypothetical protein